MIFMFLVFIMQQKTSMSPCQTQVLQGFESRSIETLES